MKIMHLATGRASIPTVTELLKELSLDIREDVIRDDDYGFSHWLRMSQLIAAWHDQDSYQWLAFHAVESFTQAVTLINIASNWALQEAATVKSLELSCEAAWAYHVAFADSVTDDTRETARKRFLELAPTTNDVLSMYTRLLPNLDGKDATADELLLRALDLATTSEECLSVCASADANSDVAFSSMTKARHLATSSHELAHVNATIKRLRQGAQR